MSFDMGLSGKESIIVNTSLLTVFLLTQCIQEYFCNTLQYFCIESSKLWNQKELLQSSASSHCTVRKSLILSQLSVVSCGGHAETPQDTSSRCPVPAPWPSNTHPVLASFISLFTCTCLSNVLPFTYYHLPSPSCQDHVSLCQQKRKLFVARSSSAGHASTFWILVLSKP